MAVNLSRQLSRPQARELLERSFAQFQADRAVVGLARQVDRNEEALAGYAESMRCHLGDFAEYFRLRQRLKERESALAREGAAARRAAAEQSLERLRPGDVIRVPSGRRSGMAVVVDPGVHPARETRPLVVTEDRWAGRLSPVDFPTPVEPLARVRVPKHFDHRSPQARRDLASTLRNARPEDAQRRRKGRSPAADDEEIARLRRELRQHPCHGCPDREEHARWAERYARLQRDTAALRNRVENRTHSIARTFDRVCALLTARGYLAGSGADAGGVTDAGRQLARIWSESDLLVAECVRAGVWDGLSGAELAAAVSALVYESRREVEAPVRMPEGPVRAAVEETRRLWAELEEDEQRHGLALTREPDPGFAWAAYRWARGDTLGAVLGGYGEEADLTAGDFVRWARQLIDLLDQVSKVSGDSPIGETARAAVSAVRRGVVAFSTVN
jgi:ATP-dependent RNA helicase HelY